MYKKKFISKFSIFRRKWKRITKCTSESLRLYINNNSHNDKTAAAAKPSSVCNTLNKVMYCNSCACQRFTGTEFSVEFWALCSCQWWWVISAIIYKKYWAIQGCTLEKFECWGKNNKILYNNLTNNGQIWPNVVSLIK